MPVRFPLIRSVCAGLLSSVIYRVSGRGLVGRNSAVNTTSAVDRESNAAARSETSKASPPSSSKAAVDIPLTTLTGPGPGGVIEMGEADSGHAAHRQLTLMSCK